MSSECHVNCGCDTRADCPLLRPIRCRACPDAGCVWCTETPATQADRANEAPEKRARNGKVGGSKTAPAGASTPVNPGPGPTETAKPHDWTYRT